MLNVAFINTFIAKLSFSPSKVTSDDFLLYPLLGKVCNLREKGIVGGEGAGEVSAGTSGPLQSSRVLPRAFSPCSDTQRSIDCLEKSLSALKTACMWN